jgi:hypothetical protein
MVSTFEGCAKNCTQKYNLLLSIGLLFVYLFPAHSTTLLTAQGYRTSKQKREMAYNAVEGVDKKLVIHQEQVTSLPLLEELRITCKVSLVGIQV